MRVNSVVVGVDLLDEVGVHFVKHFLDKFLAQLLLLLLIEDTADDVSAIVEINESGRAQFRGPLLARQNCGGVLGEGLLVVVVPLNVKKHDVHVVFQNCMPN